MEKWGRRKRGRETLKDGQKRERNIKKRTEKGRKKIKKGRKGKEKYRKKTMQEQERQKRSRSTLALMIRMTQPISEMSAPEPRPASRGGVEELLPLSIPCT